MNKNMLTTNILNKMEFTGGHWQEDTFAQCFTPLALTQKADDQTEAATALVQQSITQYSFIVKGLEVFTYPI